jgi:AraC-like DNA-binding protein
MLLLNTADPLDEDEVQALRAASGQTSVLCRIDHIGPDDATHARMHSWAFGQAILVTSDSSGFRLVLASRGEHREGPPAVPMAVRSRGLPASCVFEMPYEQLGLPADVIQAARPRLQTSPLYELVRDHLVRLAGLADEMVADPGATALGTATTELVRALLVSAAGWPVLESRESTLATRVLAYSRQHLTEPRLTPERIAGAHNISVRQLYKACADVGVRLEQWLIQQRLEAARAELTAPTGRRRSIAATARACGFTDPSHFSRRFRAAYGMTPRDWQHSAG